jgi:molybdopterin synthase sulfur carrier subunit
MKVLLFGKTKEVIGKDSVLFDDVKDTNTLLEKLFQKYPALASVKFVIAVDKQIEKHNKALHSDSTIALLPPFSGG